MKERPYFPSSDLTKKELGEFITPEPITDLIGYLGAKFEPKRVLDPACGLGGFVDALLKYCKKKPDFIRCLDNNVECVESVSNRLGSLKTVLIEAKDSLMECVLREDERYDLIMCDPPFGVRYLAANVAISTEIAFLEKCLTLLNTGGHLLILLPEGVLFRSDTRSRALRKKIIEEFNLIAVFSLSVFNLIPRASIKSSILLIRNTKPSQKPIIFGNYKDTNFDKEAIWECVSHFKKPSPPLFLIERDKIKDEISLWNHLPIEYRLGIEKQEYPFVSISEIAEILSIKDIKGLDAGSLILRRVGNFKIVSKEYLACVSDKTIKNYSLLKLRKNIDIDFLTLIFESGLFQKQIESIARGAYIKSISNKDISDVLIPLPPISEQHKIAEYYRKINEVLANTAIIKGKLLNNPFSKHIFSDKKLMAELEDFSSQTIRSNLEDLPSPIAIILRQTKNIGSGKESLENSVALFETFIRFMAVLLIMESYQRNLFGDIVEKVGVSFVQPSTGIWFNAFKNIAKEIIDIDKDNELTNNMICGQIVLKSKEMIERIEDAKTISIRNDYLGHAPIRLPDEIYKVRNDEVAEVNNYVLNEIIDTLRGYKLIYIIDYKKKGERRYARVKILMGDNRDFLTPPPMIIPAELETEKVLLVSQDYSNYIILDPLLHLGVCSECGTENLFFYDRRVKTKAEYFSYLHEHRACFDLLEDVKKLLPMKSKSDNKNIDSPAEKV
jgi:restriction endonuclease S subunit/predicted RNA methylase